MPARLPPQPSHPAGPARTESGHGRPSAIQGRTGLLTLRDGHDAAFVRRLWADTSFMRSFHRLAPPLPKEDAELVRIMNLECSNSIRQSRAVHWVVRSPDRQPWGLLSLTDISLQHKRAEVLLGVLPGAPFGLATAAMLLLFHLYFRVNQFNKLYTLVFADNPHSLKGTLHLGFQQEGLLKRHTFDPHSQTYVDVIQTGIHAQQAFCARNIRLMKKLLDQPNPTVSNHPQR